MCIAILKPKDKYLDKKILQICSDNNKDGCGFAYINNGKIYIKKYLLFEDFWKDFEPIQEKYSNNAMLIHFRIATHGIVDTSNCHPFKLNKRMALIHNGIINGYGDKNDKVDTVDFIDKVIGNIGWKNWKNPSFIELVGKAIGYSKLAILDISGDYYIVNEDKGEWVDGVWFSNSSYKERKIIKINTPKQTKINYDYNYDYDWINDYYKPVECDNEIIYYCKDCDEITRSSSVNAKCWKCGKDIDMEIGFTNKGRWYDIEGNTFVYSKAIELANKYKDLKKGAIV